jgi:hypothetical protein
MQPLSSLHLAFNKQSPFSMRFVTQTKYFRIFYILRSPMVLLHISNAVYAYFPSCNVIRSSSRPALFSAGFSGLRKQFHWQRKGAFSHLSLLILRFSPIAPLPRTQPWVYHILNHAQRQRTNGLLKLEYPIARSTHRLFSPLYSLPQWEFSFNQVFKHSLHPHLS